MAIVLPVPMEFPGTLSVSNDDHQAATGAGIRESSVFGCEWVEGNWDGGFGFESVQSPAKLTYCALQLPMWHEWVTTKNSQH